MSNSKCTIELSWQEFKKQMDGLPKPKRETDMLLFRGHVDSSWRLETTLQRELGRVSERNYYCLVRAIRPHLVTCLGDKVPLFPFNPDEYDFSQILYVPPGIEFLTFLRHNKFPSPLLDWTLSPYIAAFFAFEGVPQKFQEDKKVAIFSFKEFSDDGSHMGSDGEPWIHGIGDCIATHKRHYLQQSRYTFCIEKLQKETENFFGDHEKVCEQSQNRQDVLTKYILPWADKKTALRDLDKMNINAYSLFENEESLMESLFNRHYIFKREQKAENE
jgi:hypothetical protein